MKNLIFIVFLLIAANAYAQQKAPIQSMKDIQPYLQKYLGLPTRIDTTYRDKEAGEDFSTLTFFYNNRPDLSYKKISDVLSKGFGEPAYVIHRKDDIPYYGGLIPMVETRWGSIYKVQFYLASLNPPKYMISVFDDKGEIPIPKEIESQ